jgi:F-type H+-transporting ATPase subunit gamma
MAGSQERLLRRRIRSVESTKKITRAMELIAASQMVRAQGRIAGSRPYLSGMERVLADVAHDGTAPARLMGVPESPERVAVIAIVSDRGLCGGYNAYVLRASERLIRTGEQAGRQYSLSIVGKKAIGYFRFRGRPVAQSFNTTARPQYELAQQIAAVVVPQFLAGETDLVQLVSTRFVSAGTQVVETRQILPILPPSAEPSAPRANVPQVAPAAEADGTEADGTEPHAVEPQGTEPQGTEPQGTEPRGEGDGGGGRGGYFEYEPSPEDLLALLVPRYAEAALYQALLEASASEHVARQRAMSAATENADDLIKTLRRVMNRARQETITTEIMEIVGGAEALRRGTGRRSAPGRDLDLEEQIA